MRRHPSIPIESKKYKVVKFKRLREEVEAKSYDEARILHAKFIHDGWDSHIVETAVGSAPNGNKYSEDTILW